VLLCVCVWGGRGKEQFVHLCTETLAAEQQEKLVMEGEGFISFFSPTVTGHVNAGDECFVNRK
jgi:hypothetical protein